MDNPLRHPPGVPRVEKPRVEGQFLLADGRRLGYAEFGDPKYFNLWKKLNADPADLEIRRNMAVTQPLLWLADPNEIPILPKHKWWRL